MELPPRLVEERTATWRSYRGFLRAEALGIEDKGRIQSDSNATSGRIAWDIDLDDPSPDLHEDTIGAPVKAAQNVLFWCEGFIC